MWQKEEKVKTMNPVDLRISGADHLSALSRIVTPQQRLSSAQRTLAAMNPVAVSMAHRHDPESLRRMAARALNLKLLLQHVFDESIASMAAHLEMSPDRLRALIDLQTSFDPEIAEHLEHCLNLPGGWLDTRRAHIDTAHLKSIVFESTREEALAQEETPREPQVFRAEPALASVSAPAEQQGTTSSCSVAGNAPIVVSLTSSSNAMSATDTSSALAEQTKRDPYAATKDHRLEGPLAQAMQWFSDRLSEMESKGASAVRLGLHEKLGRAQSTISTWTNNLRRLPDDVQVPMVQAVIEMRLPFAAEFLQRMSEASPHLFTPEVKKKLEEDLQRMPADTQRWSLKSDKKDDKSAARAPQKGATAREKQFAQDAPKAASPSHAAKEEIVLAAPSLAPVSGPGVASEDFRLVVARAAEKVADVLQYIVRQPH